MGASAYSKVVYGIKVEKVELNDQVTKYDEDTGDPYLKPVPYTAYKCKNGKIIRDSDLPDLNYSGSDKSGIGIYGDYYSATKVIGEPVVDGNSWRDDGDVVEFKFLTDDEENKAVHALAELGFSGTVQYYLLTDLS